MVRVTLTGDDLQGFVSAGYDDHVKLCSPLAGQDAPVWPPGPDAPALPEGDHGFADARFHPAPS